MVRVSREEGLRCIMALLFGFIDFSSLQTCWGTYRLVVPALLSARRLGTIACTARLARNHSPLTGLRFKDRKYYCNDNIE
jgi:hypothetical protein